MHGEDLFGILFYSSQVTIRGELGCANGPQAFVLLDEPDLALFSDQWTAIASLRKTLLPTAPPAMTPEELKQLHGEAESGDLEAMHELALRLSDGMGLPQDWHKAVEWLNLAARRHHPDSQHELGNFYAFGLGVPQSHVEATRWYEKAANAGHADSQYMLGMYFQYALGEISDLERAKIWYARAADQGNVKAEKSLAILIRLTEPEGE